MLYKYLPYGIFWDSKYRKEKRVYKLLKAIELTFLKYKQIMYNNYKIFNKNNLNAWNYWLDLPDSVFSINDRNYEKFLIKLKPKSNQLNDIITVLNSLGINIEVLENSKNFLKLKASGGENLSDISEFAADLELNLTGGSAIRSIRVVNQTKNYLEAILPASVSYEVIGEN